MGQVELGKGIVPGRGMVMRKGWKVWTRRYRESQVSCIGRITRFAKKI